MVYSDYYSSLRKMLNGALYEKQVTDLIKDTQVIIDHEQTILRNFILVYILVEY